MGRGCDDDHHLISEDVLIQILLWLPVISLLRFKSVCKSWRSIIESPFFIHLHATTTTTTILPTSSSVSTTATTTKLDGSSSRNVLINTGKGKILMLSGEEFEFFFEDLVIPATLLEYILSDEMFEGLKRLQWEDAVELLMVGCCDGIICLHDYFTRNVALWNPAIKQSRILPKPSNLLGFSKCSFKMVVDDDDDGCDCQDFVRFGIDIKTNDYKVLLITTYKLRRSSYGTDPEDDGEEDRRFLRNASRRIHVYSLSTDSWKCIANADANANANATLCAAAIHPDDDLYIDIDMNEGGLYLNGSYFFTATCLNIEEGISKEHRLAMTTSLLLSFDFTGEIFRTIESPSDLRNNYSNFREEYFIRLGEKVALIDVKEDFLDKNITEFNIWVLNDQQHGVKESWTKSYTIGPPDRFITYRMPLFITNNGEFAIIYATIYDEMQDDRQHVFLQLLNLITGEKKVLRRDCEGLYRKFVHVYKPSLMPISGNGAAHK